jgi:hypothetical protein
MIRILGMFEDRIKCGTPLLDILHDEKPSSSTKPMVQPQKGPQPYGGSRKRYAATPLSNLAVVWIMKLS